MKDVTPAIDIKLSQRKRNTEAFIECLDKLSDPIGTVLDIRYGTGGWAKALERRHPESKIYGYEIDEVTAKLAFIPAGGVLAAQAFVGVIPDNWPSAWDLLLADFNNSTVQKLEPLLQALAVVEPKAVIFTDVASSKLHMNYRFYGLSSADLGEYYKQFKIEGYELVHWARKQHHASTSLWVRAK